MPEHFASQPEQIDLEMCYKYFVFLNRECDRYLRDKKIEEEEIANLKIEFDRFIVLTEESELPQELKSKMVNLQLDYTYHPHRDDINMIIRLVFGRIFAARRAHQLKKKVEAFKFEIKGIPTFIQLNYPVSSLGH